MSAQKDKLKAKGLLAEFLRYAGPLGLTASCWMVGGTVRDMLLGIKKPADIDLACNCDVIKLARGFARKCDGTFVMLDEALGMVRVVKGQEHLDLSRLRGEGIEDDLRERDITINAMALALAPYGGKLIDPLGGQKDLMRGRIRMVAEKNLRDDPLRVLRCYRFMTMPGLRIERKTARILKKLAPLLAAPARERITEELKCILLSGSAALITDRMRRDGVLRYVMPGAGARGISAVKELDRLLADFPFAQQFGQVARREAIPMKLAALAWADGRPLVRLALSSAQVRSAAAIPVFARRFLRLYQGKAGREALVRAMRDSGDLVYVYLICACARRSGKRSKGGFFHFAESVLEDYIKTIRPRLGRKLVTGDDLITGFGLKPSPLIGKILDRVEMLWLTGKITNRRGALEAAGRFLRAVN
ncbi:MAG: hypothetical protein M0Z52_09050 [Actinomycetota bacterium]|nr:hypothetical protein [Actinomycetota bacterium]